MNDGAMNYVTLRQGVEAVRDPENAPAVSMSVYLVALGEEERFRRISIYQERGATRDAVRLLYMNREALAVWRAMGRPGEAIGERHRPPRTALLSFGVPFSE